MHEHTHAHMQSLHLLSPAGIVQLYKYWRAAEIWPLARNNTVRMQMQPAEWMVGVTDIFLFQIREHLWWHRALQNLHVGEEMFWFACFISELNAFLEVFLFPGDE